MPTETKELGRIPPYDASKAKRVPRPARTGFTTEPVFMPRRLRFVDYDTSKSPQQMEELYGTWRIKILKPVSLGWGRHAQPGESLEISGDIAGLLVLQGQAQWNDDPKINEELAAIAKARELGIPLATYQKLDLTPEKPKKWPLT